MKRGFTLIELLISITILSIMMLYLYKSYASLNYSNNFYKKEVKDIKEEESLKKVIFLDFSLALSKSTTILNQDKKEDVILMQSSNSLHNMYNPYVAYLVKDKKLYRLESLRPLFYPLNVDSEFSVDIIGEVNSFRVYKSDRKIGDTVPELFLLYVDFKEKKDILLKIKVLNSK
ncbi:MAG: type II secretion system protein [Campylobacterales bacterium]|nr:type II secretion system protein [Campylobacterales bacterium]